MALLERSDQDEARAPAAQLSSSARSQSCRLVDSGCRALGVDVGALVDGLGVGAGIGSDVGAGIGNSVGAGIGSGVGAEEHSHE